MLDGHALMEHWHDVDGHEGKSWFYYAESAGLWKQVWVTDTGAVKEKTQMPGGGAGAVCFRGEILLKDGRRLLDQTTLRLLPDGRVHQQIEQSVDHGASWRTVYEADYSRRPANP